MQKIVLRIRKNNEHAGTIDFGIDNKIRYLDSISLDLEDIIALALREGIPLESEIHDDASRMIVQKTITLDHPLFPFAFIRFLEAKDYTVMRRYPEVEAEITELLNIFPDWDENKKRILKELDAMSYLEQSAVLEELKRD